MTGNSATAATAIDNSSHTIVKLGRLGYAAKGIVYMVIGFLATEAAFGRGGRATDTKGALRAIGEGPFGKFALVVIAIGLLGYAAWRLVSAATGAERGSGKPSAIALRIGDAVRGLAYGSLGVWALKLLTNKPANSGNRAPGIVEKVMGMPGGRTLVMVGGLILLGYAIYQIHKAITGRFLKRLDLSSASARTREWVEHFGQFGISSRAIVFGMIGILTMRAAQTYNPAKAGGIAQSLNAIAHQPKGHLLFAVVAIGLIAYGLFQIATAKYRVMRAG
jgi:hypothetical protein